MNPITLTITILLILSVLILPRRLAVLSVVAAVFYLTQVNFITVSGVDLMPIRVIILVGFIRVFIRKEISFNKLNRIDKSFLLYASVSLLIYIIRSHVNPGLHSSVMYKIGIFIDSIFTYFIFRGLIKDYSMLSQLLRDMVLLLIPFTLLMISESLTGRNIFSAMGGVNAISLFRNGYFRSQASFRHSITAGSMGATLLPLYIGLIMVGGRRVLAVAGVLLSFSITIASHSSGPLMALISGIVAWCTWPWRDKMRLIRRAIVGSLLALHLAMNAPVWFIFDRISGVIGGDGWHRANLIDKFVENFSTWWLMGMPIEETGNWAATRMSWGGVDITNEYISIGISGGLLSLILFIWMLTICYQSIGKCIEKVRNEDKNNKVAEMLLWGLGCALLSHTINLSGVTYWDQSWVMWYMLLAVISSVTEHYLRDKTALP